MERIKKCVSLVKQFSHNLMGNNSWNWENRLQSPNGLLKSITTCMGKNVNVSSFSESFDGFGRSATLGISTLGIMEVGY